MMKKIKNNKTKLLGNLFPNKTGVCTTLSLSWVTEKQKFFTYLDNKVKRTNILETFGAATNEDANSFLISSMFSVK